MTHGNQIQALGDLVLQLSGLRVVGVAESSLDGLPGLAILLSEPPERVEEIQRAIESIFPDLPVSFDCCGGFEFA